MKGNSKAGTPTQERTRYTELKQMLEERRREIQAEVQGRMRDVRSEGAWGGKQSEVLDAVESSEVDIQEDIEFALIQMKSETLNKIDEALDPARGGRLRQLLRVRRRKSPRSGCGRCPSRSAARTARRPARSPSSGSGSWPPGAARRRCSSTCNIRRPESSRGSAGGGALSFPPTGAFPQTISGRPRDRTRTRSP